MIAAKLTLVSLIISSTHALSIGTVSEHNVTKRESNLGDLFPDWVPFKNKQGQELGEFVQVSRKPKKRLAQPVNFILKAVAEPEGDDYYEKGQGDNDNEDYYEKKDWSDSNRPVQTPESIKPQNHTEISEIDGVVNIITNKTPTNPIVEAITKAKLKNSEELEKEEKKLLDTKYTSAEDIKNLSRKKARKYEDDIDYEDSNTEKRKPETMEDEQSENEAKKARILDTVDQLKARHAKEQVALSEKFKEEEIYKEEREREKIQAQLSLPENDKYDERPKSRKKYPDYEEYEERDVSLDEKYRASPERTKPTTTTKLPKRTNRFKEKKVESGKLSVFKNPQLYIVYDDDSEETTTLKSMYRESNVVKPYSNQKYSAKYSSTPTGGEDHDRISLLPDENDGKEGEPTLFFPKKRKSKKNKQSKATTESENLYRATLADYKGKGKKDEKKKDDKKTDGKKNVEKNKITTTETTLADTTVGDTSGTDTTGSDSKIVDTTIETGPSSTDIEPTHTEGVTDAVPASTHHHKEPEKKEEDYHRETGGGKEHNSEHEEEHHESGKKAYEGVHKETKTTKGYHDKENHVGNYDDHGGIDKHHEEESGHYGDHHHEEHGKKHAKYEESGKHSKGHSTKGSHDIHKKDEYEKKVEFFEEEGDSGEDEKHGGFNEEHSHAKGGHYKNGRFHSGHEEHAKGDSGHFAKGGHLHVSKGHKAAVGHDSHGKHGIIHHQKESKDGGKKWIYHHGYPPKTANLVLIDRRADQFYHGPQYYG